MRVIIITAMFPPNRTGTSFYSQNLATALVNMGVTVEVITTINDNPNNDNKLNYTVRRIAAWHFPIKNFFKHLRFCGLIPSNYKRVSRLIRDFNADAVILVNHYLDIAFPAIHGTRKNKIPLYVSVGTQLQSLSKSRDRLLRIMDRLIVGGLIFPKAKRIISWDREIERYIEEVHSKKNASKSVIIPFGVNGDIRQFDQFESSYEKVNQILGVGAIIGHRDYVYQLKVFAKLLERFPDMIFKIIGNQYIDRPKIIAKELGIEDKVIFTGELSHAEVLKEYQNSVAHWMMLNGRYVGLGTSTLEAMLMGVPSFSNSPEGLLGKGRLKDMENYIHTDGKSIDKDVERLTRIITDKELRTNIGKNGRVFIKNFLNWETVAGQFVDMIKKDTSK